MTKYFATYTSVVQRLVKNYNKEISQLISDKNIDEVWERHDDWNGGIDFYNIVISIPVDVFDELRRKGVLEETEGMINRCYTDAMRGDGDSLQLERVILKPTMGDIQTFGEIIDDSMWKYGYFRLFISHLTENKSSASNLKSCLINYGIDCFVAHEDIMPSKEWEIEIEKALFTTDALCAIVAPKFINSQWCDQEVGIALGQKKLVFSIDKGAIPYGFFGKYQAVKSKTKSANDIANEVWKIISQNERTKSIYFSKLIALVLGATNEEDARHLINVIKKCGNINKQNIENLYENFTSNNILNTAELIDLVNPIFKSYGLPPLTRKSSSILLNDGTDLPF